MLEIGGKMQLYVLDKNPVISANLLPDKYKFKMLIELAQMVSTITCSTYKPVRQGKVIMNWIKNNGNYTKMYYNTLLTWALKNINMKEKTILDLLTIYKSMVDDIRFNNIKSINTAIFRYKNTYKSNIKTDEELCIDKCIEEYKKYLKWKLEV